MMVSHTTSQELRSSLKEGLRQARNATDSLFNMIDPDALKARPIRERHRIVFYIGHLEAFDWNLLARSTLGLEPFNASFDELFAFGIDPLGGAFPTDSPADWPGLSEITEYSQRIRLFVDNFLETVDFDQSADLENGLVFNVAIEHRLMHAETLAYMLHWLDPDQKRQPGTELAVTGSEVTPPRTVEIPPGRATLGQARDDRGFGWDNEYGEVSSTVPGFTIDARNVSNGQYLEFLKSGGYEERSIWTDSDWRWKSETGLRNPRFWERHGDRWMLRNMFDVPPLPLSWPVYVSHAEAAAYVRWIGRALPTEVQLHRAAYGTPDGAERPYPWGLDPPGMRHGNFDFHGWDPTPVGAFPGGNSAFGVSDLLGNGWEWTSTVFEPFEGFERFHFYPGYSSDFFDGKHFVMKGGSPRTAARMLRRSFRNWFQPHYPHIYATFRSVEA